MSSSTSIFPNSFGWKTAPLSSVYYPPLAIVSYLALIFSLQRLMRHRPPIRVPLLTFVHNLFLCILSLLMCLGVVTEILKLLINNPFPTSMRYILCDPNSHSMTSRLGWWMYVFYLSKFYELIDTLIMVLKKRPLNFLHVYHHCIVIPLFYVYMSTSMILQWILVVANSSVHVAMYYYYAMSAVGQKVWWKKYITQAQIVQFIIDLTATWPYPFLYFSQSGCSGSMRGWLFGQAVGLSFFKLFCDFYFRSYTKSKALTVEHTAVNPAQPLDTTSHKEDDLQKKSQ
eukprot:GFKZ01015512.1.p1 GENE.GFKZ01015512.1~~GFKZ01015512.1.p1  ORF type:complete len:285 (-),score=26.14 GFKZ01015512.1:481-1335(-)